MPWGDDRELFVNNCGTFHFDWANGSEFSIVDLGGNDYFGDPTQVTWLPAWLMPNLITCNDRPPVRPPPAPSEWKPKGRHQPGSGRCGRKRVPAPLRLNRQAAPVAS